MDMSKGRKSSKDIVSKKWDTAKQEGYNNQTDIGEVNIDSETSNVFFPIAIRGAAKTISSDLVQVSPMVNKSEVDRIEKEVLVENRGRKIDAIVSEKEYQEMKKEEHPDWGKATGPKDELFYFDVKYRDSGDDSTDSKV